LAGDEGDEDEQWTGPEGGLGWRVSESGRKSILSRKMALVRASHLKEAK
jgi:hypothetical protein